MLHTKYNGKMYYCKVPWISNCSWKYKLLILKPVGKISYTKPNIDDFCGINISSTIIKIYI